MEPLTYKKINLNDDKYVATLNSRQNIDNL